MSANFINTKLKLDDLIDDLLLSNTHYENETEYLMSILGMRDIIIEGMNTPLSECLDLDEVDLWEG